MGNYYNERTILYLNGEFVKASSAKIDLYSQSLHYGYAVFEGIRSYRTKKGDTKIFKAIQHFERLKKSADALNIYYPHSSQELINATYELLERNGLQNAYIRPLVFAPANMGFTRNVESFIAIEVWEMGLFLGDHLIKVMTSSYERPNPKAFKIEAKATGHYVNSILASQEAKLQGFDEALLNDVNGFVAEAPGANMFFEKDSKLYTPPLGNILPGITRATVIEICNELAIPVEEKLFTTEEVKLADAAFFCGTATEIAGWYCLDEVRLLKVWEDTLCKTIQDAYKAKVVEDEFKMNRTSAPVAAM